MRHWRFLIVGVLFAVPFIALAALGVYYLLSIDLWFYVWWPLAASMILAYVLAWHWQRTNRLIRGIDFTPSIEWTDRDRQAWKLVQARAEAATKLSPERLSSLAFFTDTAQEMAVELAAFYHPKASDPISALTIPEILAVVELAAHDLAELTDRYLPGGHLLTLRDWQRAKQISDWYPTARQVYWLISGMFSPLNTAARYLTTQVGMSQPLQRLQENLIAWFVTAYIHRIGTYLIDVNSGRLRVGAKRYKELRQSWLVGQSAAPSTPATDGVDATVDAVQRVGIAVIGQVKAGKSSLINSLLGERRAGTDVLPLTNEITRYSLAAENVPTRLEILDSVGYGHAGPREDQLRVTHDMARQSDVILLVCHARNPARQADLAALRDLHNWFSSKPDLRRPPILAVMTHIDLLSPAMEWSPPYDWMQPQKPKEQAIHDARQAIEEQLGEFLVGIVPVCAVPGKEYGIRDRLLPAVVELLDEARAVGFLRCLQREASAVKIRKVLSQLLEVGKLAAQEIWLRPPR